ncbi:MAG: hypothetical protein VB104_07935 [Candidatus Limiplasma sp.]|nr:hypothetical protein [Candidatus Limiplasma sp.]
MGLTLADFWGMTPRGVHALLRERARDVASAGAAATHGEPGQEARAGNMGKGGVRLARIPR